MMKTHGLSLEILEPAAQQIIDQALYYREESPDTSLEERWDKAINQAIRSLLSMPERGSRCRFQSPALQQMRWIPVEGFPQHIVFYIFLAKERTIRIVNILHGARDLGAYFDSTSP